MSEGLAIGIDLGTTNTCLAVWQNGKVNVIQNSSKQTTTLSCVSFGSSGYFVGSLGADSIFEAKRIIGKNYVTAKNYAKYWPFDVVDDGNNIPKYEVKIQNQLRQLYPVQISALILKKVKDDAESQLGQKISDAVITVPAYFNDAQREATKDAAFVAGINVLKIINEPAASALAFGYMNKVEDERKVLIYDLGRLSLNFLI